MLTKTHTDGIQVGQEKAERVPGQKTLEKTVVRRLLTAKTCRLLLPDASHFLKVEKIGDMTCADLTVFHVPQTPDPSPYMLASRTSGEDEAYREHGGSGIQVLERFQCQCSSWTSSASLCISSHGRTTGNSEPAPGLAVRCLPPRRRRTVAEGSGHGGGIGR